MLESNALRLTIITICTAKQTFRITDNINSLRTFSNLFIYYLLHYFQSIY